jgi:hypothetical protein
VRERERAEREREREKERELRDRQTDRQSEVEYVYNIIYIQDVLHITAGPPPSPPEQVVVPLTDRSNIELY